MDDFNLWQELILGATKPFRTGANILAQNWGSALTGKDMSQEENQGKFLQWLAGGLTDEEQQVINDKPYLSALKSGAGMASTLAPFGTQGLRAAQFATNPLTNRLAQLTSQGALEGSMGGFGYSREGREVEDTLLGTGLGIGGELLADYITNPQFRKMLSDASTFEGPNGTSMYRGALGDDTGITIKRRGDIDKNGAYFSTGEGMSTYFDEFDPEVKTYTLKNARIVSSDTNEAKQVLQEALKDKGNSPEAIVKIKESLQDGFIDYQMNDEIPSIVNAARDMGYDGIKVWENDSIGNPDSIFLWNTQKASIPGDIKINNYLDEPDVANVVNDDIPITRNYDELVDPDNPVIDLEDKIIDKRGLGFTKPEENVTGGFVDPDNPVIDMLKDDPIARLEIEAKNYATPEEFVEAIAGKSGYTKEGIGDTRNTIQRYDPQKDESFADPMIKRGKIKVFRATTKDSLLPGDFVATHENTAKGFLRYTSDKKAKIISEWVPLKDLYTTQNGYQVYKPGGKTLLDIWNKAHNLKDSAKELRGGFKEILDKAKKEGIK